MGKSKHKKEVKMPQNETPPEQNEQTTNQGSAEAEISAREAADLDERLSAERIAQARNESEAAGAAAEATEPTLIGAAAKGRDHLLNRLREHSAKEAEKAAYSPPPMTDRMRERLEEEQAAGRRATERHQAQLDYKPVPKPDPREGQPGRPVHRPNDVVPDPTVLAPSGFAAGTKRFSPNV